MSKWTTLEASVASNHHLYGIKGTASFFKVFSVLIPFIGLISGVGKLPDIMKIREVLPIDYFLLMPYAIFFVWAGYNSNLLQKHDVTFLRSFFISLAACPIISVSVQLIWILNQPTPLNAEEIAIGAMGTILAWTLWTLIWAPYFLYSKRINVTLLHRVKAQA